MATFTKFNSFVEALAEKKHDLGADTLRVLYTNSAPSASNTQKSDLTEISAGNGYSAGGPVANQTSSAQSSGTYKLVVADTVITATGAVGPYRYVVLYNDTSTNDLLIGFWDIGSSRSLTSGETETADFDASNGVLQIA